MVGAIALVLQHVPDGQPDAFGGLDERGLLDHGQRVPEPGLRGRHRNGAEVLQARGRGPPVASDRAGYSTGSSLMR